MLFVLYGATLDMGYETRKFFRGEGFEIINKYNYVADDAMVDKDKYVNASQDENYAKWYDDKIYVEREFIDKCDFRYDLDGVYLGFDQQQIMDAVHGVKDCLLTVGGASLNLVLQLKRAYGNYVTIINIFEDYDAVLKSIELGGSISDSEKKTRVKANLGMQKRYIENTDAFDEVVIYASGHPIYDLDALHIQYRSIIKRRKEIEKVLNDQKYVSLPYEGSEPFLFISYSHSDKDSVFSTMVALQRNSYRLWYDDGIHGGDNWMKILAQKIEESCAVILFCSEDAMNSRFVQTEFRRAINLDKKIYTIKLDDSPMTMEFDMFLSGNLIIDHNTPDLEKRLLKALPEEARKTN